MRIRSPEEKAPPAPAGFFRGAGGAASIFRTTSRRLHTTHPAKLSAPAKRPPLGSPPPVPAVCRWRGGTGRGGSNTITPARPGPRSIPKAATGRKAPSGGGDGLGGGPGLPADQDRPKETSPRRKSPKRPNLQGETKPAKKRRKKY